MVQLLNTSSPAHVKSLTARYVVPPVLLTSHCSTFNDKPKSIDSQMYVLDSVMKATNGKISSRTPRAWHLPLSDGSCQDLPFTIAKVRHKFLWRKQAVRELIRSLESENMGVVMRL